MTSTEFKNFNEITNKQKKADHVIRLGPRTLQEEK